MTTFPLVLLFGCGLLMVVQATINSAFGKDVGLPLFTVIFSLTQFLCAIPLLFVWRDWSWERLAASPWWHHVGGALGVILLTGIAYGIGRVGAFATQISLILGQLTMSLMIDHFGLWGVPAQPVSLARIVSVGLVFGAILLNNRGLN